MPDTDGLETIYIHLPDEEATLRRRIVAFKRLLDLSVSMLLLGLAFPIILIAALAIRLTSPGSVLF